MRHFLASRTLPVELYPLKRPHARTIADLGVTQDAGLDRTLGGNL